MEDVFGRAGLPHQVVARGTTVSPYFTGEPVRDARVAARSDKELFERITVGLQNKGYYAKGGMGLLLSEPMTTDHVDGFLESLETVVSEK